MGGSTKQALLQALSAAEGAYISGQQLAEALGVSRAAVHKAAQALLAQGYALDSAPRRGYRLAGGDPFCAEAVGEYDAPIYLYDKLESSNRTAKTLALEGAPHGTMVLTSQQTAGRGRMGRGFESPAGLGLYLSMLWRPVASPEGLLPLTAMVSASAALAIRRVTGADVRIKWPNDIYWKDKKICGTLIENDLTGIHISRSISGTGVNLNQERFISDAPNPVSLFQITCGSGRKISLRRGRRSPPRWRRRATMWSGKRWKRHWWTRCGRHSVTCVPRRPIWTITGSCA